MGDYACLGGCVRVRGCAPAQMKSIKSNCPCRYAVLDAWVGRKIVDACGLSGAELRGFVQDESRTQRLYYRGTAKLARVRYDRRTVKLWRAEARAEGVAAASGPARAAAEEAVDAEAVAAAVALRALEEAWSGEGGSASEERRAGPVAAGRAARAPAASGGEAGAAPALAAGETAARPDAEARAPGEQLQLPLEWMRAAIEAEARAVSLGHRPRSVP